MTWWAAPRLWPGETVAILGGGESLKHMTVNILRGRCRVLAINNAYQLAPWADCLYFCDERWHGWHKDRADYQAFAGLRVTLDNVIPGVHMLKNMGTEGLQMCPWGLATGRNSGIQAINLAVHFGVSRILLLGYDMRPGYFHDGHPTPTRPGVYADAMLPQFPAVADALDRLGVECVNCTPGSSLTTFRMDTIENALQHGQHPV